MFDLDGVLVGSRAPISRCTDSGADLIVDDPEDLPGAIDELL